jgi:hypothetical protein
MTPLVAMRPGYTVPPTTRPRGYHAVGSNQFQNSCPQIQHDIDEGPRVDTHRSLLTLVHVLLDYIH